MQWKTDLKNKLVAHEQRQQDQELDRKRKQKESRRSQVKPRVPRASQARKPWDDQAEAARTSKHIKMRRSNQKKKKKLKAAKAKIIQYRAWDCTRAILTSTNSKAAEKKVK